MFNKILLLLFISPLFLFCQDSMTGKFSPAKDYKFGILYRLTPTGKVYAKDAKMEEDGSFKLNLDSTIAKGSYRLVYNLPEEDHYFDLIYDGKEEISFTFSEDSGVQFSDSQNKILSEYLNEINTVEKKIDSELDEDNPNKTKLEKLFGKQAEIQKEAEIKSQNTFAYVFINAHKPYIPGSFKNRGIYFGSKKDSFFNNFDFENEELQSSSFPLKMIEAYYDDFVTKQGGSFYRSIINDIHFEIRNCDANFQKNLLADFWQSLVDKNKKTAANYLAESYLIELAASVNDTSLSEKLDLFKNLSIGATAPNFSWVEENNKERTLYTNQGAAYYVLAFWSTGCSHCMEQMPVFHEKMRNLNSQKIEVIAIGLEMEDQPWKDSITQLSGFTHVLRTDEDRMDITKRYDVTATPTYFVLDKDKKIIGRPRGQKNLSRIIDTLEAYDK